MLWLASPQGKLVLSPLSLHQTKGDLAGPLLFDGADGNRSGGSAAFHAALRHGGIPGASSRSPPSALRFDSLYITKKRNR